MLTVDDYNHLKMLYEEFRKTNSHIKDLMQSDDWDSVETAIAEKNTILKNIIFFEKSRINDIKENDELNKIRLELIELEKNNIEMAKTMQQKLAQEINNVHKTNMLKNAYNPSAEPVSTINLSDSE